MTFPNFPKRSTSEDEALDQSLNTWANSAPHSERSEESRPVNSSHPDDLTTAALEFHRWADETLRSDRAATGPAADTWNRVLRSTAQTQSRGGDMSSVAMSTSTQTAFGLGEKPFGRQQVTRYLNYAASLLIVFGVAFAGAFMAMQINQHGGSNGPFALFSQTGDAAACDVEPMTVDGVMEIVENPYRYMDEDDYPKPWGSSNPPTPWEDDYQEVFPRLSSPIGTGYGDEPTQTAFDDASAVISRYIACLQEDGSVAMMLRFSDPFSIQHHIRMEFPFYRSEDQVREYVTEWLQSGDQYHSLEFERQGEMLTFRQSDQKSGAGTQIHDFGMGFDQIIYIGSEVYQESGEFIGYYHPNVRQISGENLNYGMLFTLLHSRYTGEWYVVTDGRWLISGDV